MKNMKVAKILDEIADILEMKEVEFKPRAYRKAATTVRSLSKDVEEVKKEGKLSDLPGIGESIAEKIEEIVETGSLKYYEELKEEYPIDLEALLSIEGVGPKTVKELYKELDIKSLEDLKEAAENHKIKEIKGFGEKTEQKILENMKFAEESSGRKLLGYILPVAEELLNNLRKMDAVEKAEIAGSLRRRKETIGDIDIIATSKKPDEVMDFFTSLENVEDVIAKGSSKSTVRLKEGLESDLRIVEKNAFGSALLYFTGSKQTNIKMRKLALKSDWKLNEYGLFNNENRIAGKTEEEVFEKLGLQYIPPELREDQGEIEATQKEKIPKLINYGDVKGDLHVHSKMTDGTYKMEEMAKAAEDFGHKYMALTDHAGNIAIAGGLKEKEIRKQMKRIDELNKKNQNFTILKGAEVNIKSDGNIDVKDSLLKDLDVVVASIHSGFRKSKKKLTSRITTAMQNEQVDIIAHPTGRKIGERKAYMLDLEKVFEVAKDTGTALEINSYPDRLDLNGLHVRNAIEAKCKIVISTDSHNIEHLRYINLGIAMARRGWAQKKDVINTYDLKNFKKKLK